MRFSQALTTSLCLVGILASSPRNPGTIPSRLRAELERAKPKDGEVHPMVAAAAAIDRSKWTASADSFQTGNAPANVLDSSTTTIWHTGYSPVNIPLPHNITIDMKKVLNLTGLVYTPRQDGSSNGNIGKHQVYVSTDNSTWTLVAFGTYLDDSEVKATPFVTTPARYLRINAITEAGNRGELLSSD
jgi:galactose oxidase